MSPRALVPHQCSYKKDSLEEFLASTLLSHFINVKTNSKVPAKNNKQKISDSETQSLMGGKTLVITSAARIERERWC